MICTHPYPPHPTHPHPQLLPPHPSVSGSPPPPPSPHPRHLRRPCTCTIVSESAYWSSPDSERSSRLTLHASQPADGDQTGFYLFSKGLSRTRPYLSSSVRFATSCRPRLGICVVLLVERVRACSRYVMPSECPLKATDQQIQLEVRERSLTSRTPFSLVRQLRRKLASPLPSSR